VKLRNPINTKQPVLDTAVAAVLVVVGIVGTARGVGVVIGGSKIYWNVIQCWSILRPAIPHHHPLTTVPLYPLLVGPCQKLLTWVRSCHFFIAWVGSGQPPLNLNNFPQKSQTVQFFFLRGKKILSDWAKKYAGQRWVSPLFTASQKYGQVGSKPIPIEVLLMAKDDNFSLKKLFCLFLRVSRHQQW